MGAEEALAAKLQARLIADMAADPRANRKFPTRLAARGVTIEILLEMAGKYLVEAHQLKTELEAQKSAANTARQISDAKSAALHQREKDMEVLQQECGKLRHELATARSEMQCIVNKVQFLQPAGSPPPGGSPVMMVYWIVDSTIQKLHGFS